MMVNEVVVSAAECTQTRCDWMPQTSSISPRTLRKFSSGEQMYRPDEALSNLLESYGLGNEPVAFSRIIQCVGQHIKSRNLFHRTKADVIYCDGDPLGVIFDRSSFNTCEAIDLIRMHIYPVYPQKQLELVPEEQHDLIKVQASLNPGSYAANGHKNEDLGSVGGKTLFESIDCSNSKSDISCQGLAAPFNPYCDDVGPSSTGQVPTSQEFSECRDNRSCSTSDARNIVSAASKASSDSLGIPSERWQSDPFEIDAEVPSPGSLISFLTEYNEFEPQSASESDGALDFISSSSDLEMHALNETITMEGIGDGEEDFFADASDTDDSGAVIAEKTALSLWFCHCRSPEVWRGGPRNFCRTCWTARFGWRKGDDRRIPPRMQHRRKRAAKSRCASKVDSVEDMIQPQTKKPCPQGSGSSSLSASIEPKGASVSLDDSTENSLPMEALGACIICKSRTRMTALVHGRSAHAVACYECSRKLQKKGLKCPQCQRTVERIVKLFL